MQPHRSRLSYGLTTPNPNSTSQPHWLAASKTKMESRRKQKRNQQRKAAQRLVESLLEDDHNLESLFDSEEDDTEKGKEKI
ncbi:hypothetical protein PCASD_09605 [Puccinia coronata f. sp. avenae]|uniref:Uncharacterized protein n=1 Tax=Puccinia coronata f. sp. avenae TaxID=200324 RepID=A0A2N5UPM6_9BASI|nr:hypothetical protein PCASD_09605 [Puccinia coronata f. sp. avenae]